MSVRIDGIEDPFPDTSDAEMAAQQVRNMIAERTGGLDLSEAYRRVLDLHGGDEVAADAEMERLFGDLLDDPPPGARPDERGSLPDIVDRKVE